MKIQNNSHVARSANAPECEKINNGDFGKLLKEHIKPGAVDLLIKDSFSDVRAEILREIENISSDETGHNIDMETLGSLLELL